MTLYEVIDTHTGKRLGGYKTLKRAYRKVSQVAGTTDYAAIERYMVRRIDPPLDFVNCRGE